MQQEISIPYQPNERQYEFHACGAVEVVYGGAKGGGKLLQVMTPLPTPGGFVPIKDVRPGDTIFGADGKPYTVTAESEIVTDSAWRLLFDDGSEITAHSDHLWLTFTAKEMISLARRTPEFREKRRNKRASKAKGNKTELFSEIISKRNRDNAGKNTKTSPTGSVKTTKEIVETLKTKNGWSNHSIPVAAPLELPVKNLPLDPYLMGVWLGDGSTSSGSVTTQDPEVVEAFVKAGYKIAAVTEKENNAAKTYRFEGLREGLKKAGVFGNKHVPHDYLWSSEEQRIALLQGLMDSDGTASGGSAEFLNTNKKLTEAVYHLAVSLGMKVSMREKQCKLYGRVCRPAWIVKWRPNIAVFRLPYKRAEQVIATSSRTRFRFIVGAEKVENVTMKCISVSSPDRLYLAGHSMIPTHNSCALVMEALAYALENEGAVIYLFRETYDDLESNLIAEWKKRVPEQLYSYHESKHIAKLMNGSIIYFRYIKNKSDAEGYDGRSIDLIGIDELTKHDYPTVQILMSCLRSPKGFPVRFRGTCNPGGIGHKWVKDRYILSTNKGKKGYVDKESGNTIAFIPAKVYDNFAIMDNDPAYVRRLENLPPKKRQAYLHGDWDMYDGQAFEEFDPKIHVIEPFVIPEHWYRWRAVDNGYSDPFAWYWFTVDELGFVYIYREFTRERDDPKISYSEQAQKVVKLSTYVRVNTGLPQSYSYYQERIGATYCGHDAFASNPLAQGKTISTYYNQGGVNGVLSAVPDRRLRKGTWHEYLKLVDLGEGKKLPRVRIFNTCKKLVETLPSQVEDEKDPEKVAETDYDHWYDGAGYGLVAYHVTYSLGQEPLPPPPLPDALRTDDEMPEGDGIAEYLWND